MKKFILATLYLSVMVSVFASRVCAQETPVNFIDNPGFETAAGWQVQLQDGAQGSFTFDGANARSGKQSLKLSKTNGVGYIELRSIKPIRIEPKTLYTFRGWFHGRNAPISSLLLFRTSTDGKSLRYNSIDRTAGWMSQSLLINSPAGQWHPRAITYQSDTAQEIYLHVVLWGNPATVWLDDLELALGTKKGQSSPINFTTPFSKEQVLEVLEKRPSASAQVVRRNGEVQFEINGEKKPFVIYKGMAPNERNGDQEAFGKDGVDITIVPVQLGQSRFAYIPAKQQASEKLIWEAYGKINFDVIDEVLALTLQRNPQAYLILDMWTYPYREWGAENPDDVVRNDKGEKAYGIWGNLTGYTGDLDKANTAQNKAWWYPSYQSAKWRADSGKALAAIAEHLKKSPYGKAVIGFFITGGHDGRFTPFFYDYSPASQASFRAWVLKKYGSVEKVAAAWKQPLASAQEITVPTFDQHKMEELVPYQTPGALLDYREFREAGSWDLRDGYAGTLKQAIGKPVVALSYNAPVNENFLRTKHLDASGDMTYYPYRNPGYSLAWLPGDGFKYHNKMFLQELDLRSWVGARYDEVYQMWIGAGLTPQSWDNVHRKMVGASLARGYGWWYYDMGRYFADPAIHEKIAETQKIVQRYNAMPADTFKAQVCIVNRSYPNPYLSSNYTAVDSADNYQQAMLESSGVPFEVHDLDDVLSRPELQDFKVYVFRQNTYISQTQRQQIKDKLLNRNRVVVWMNDAGYISEAGKSAQQMSELIGMNINTSEKYARLTAIVTDEKSPWTKGTLPYQGTAEMVLAVFNTNGGVNSFAARYQPFWVDDASATVLAKYRETGQTAIAVKKQTNWTSLYLAAPQALEPQLLNNIARQAGAFIGGDAGQQLHMNGNFASLHGLQNGSFILHLPPGKSRVLDAVTGKVLASGKQDYTFTVEAQKTYWFFFE